MVIAAAWGFDAAIDGENMRRLTLLKQRLNGTPPIVVGCLAGVNADRLREQLDAMPLRPADVMELDRIISATTSHSDVLPVNDTRTLISVAQNCRRFCERHPNVSRLKRLTGETKQAARVLLRRLHVEEPVMRSWKRLTGRRSVFRIRVAGGGSMNVRTTLYEPQPEHFAPSRLTISYPSLTVA